MGWLDNIIETVIETPGKIIEKTAETIVRIPEVGIKAVGGAIEGIEKGVKKVEKSLDKHSY